MQNIFIFLNNTGNTDTEHLSVLVVKTDISVSEDVVEEAAIRGQ